MQGMATIVYGGGKHYFNVTVKDDRTQAHYITDEIEANLKEGMPLRPRAPLLGLASLSKRCESEYDPPRNSRRDRELRGIQARHRKISNPFGISLLRGTRPIKSGAISDRGTINALEITFGATKAVFIFVWVTL